VGLLGVAVGSQHLTEERLGGHPRLRAGRQHGALTLVGHHVDEATDQVADEVRMQRVPPSSPPRTTTSAHSDSPSGWPCVSAINRSCSAGSTPQATEVVAAVLGSRLRSDTTRNRSRHAGSARQPDPGRRAPRQDRQRADRQPRDQLLPDPVVDRRKRS
jgi:hypothetical protein